MRVEYDRNSAARTPLTRPKNRTSKLGDRIENRFGPIKNPVTGDESEVCVRIPGGWEYSANGGEALILQSQTMASRDGIAFDYSGCHTSLVEQQTFGSHR